MAWIGFCFILCSMSCNKEKLRQPFLPPLPMDTIHSKLTILWQKPLTADTIECGGHAHFIWNDNVLFSTSFTAPNVNVEMRNGATGYLQWRFNNFSKVVGDFTPSQSLINVRHTTIMNSWGHVYCVDNQTGHQLWSSTVPDPGGGEPSIHGIGDYIYACHFSGGKPATISESLVRSHYLSGHWDTLITFQPRQGGMYLNIAPPTFWINPGGDTILIIRNSISLQPSINGQSQTADLFAFNLRTRQLEWQLDDFDTRGVSPEGQPLISGNRLFFCGYKTLHCIDLINGNTLWSKYFEGGIEPSVVEHQNMVIVQSSWIGMWGLDKNTGNTVWHNEDTDGSASVLQYYDGIVYFTSTGYARLYAIDCSNGKTIWGENSPNRPNPKTSHASFGWQGVVIDPQRKVLYTTDKYYAMCIKLPE